MATISIPGPATFYVRWSCRRCGHTGGYAKTTLPIVTKEWTEPMTRHLLDALRLKLIKVHMRGQGCIAVADDFRIERGVPSDATLAGLI